MKQVVREKVLVVEDEKITGLDICQMVWDLGYQPIGPIASGEDAYAVALSERPDIILMDITLKGQLNGIETAVAIRCRYRCPVVFVTAHSDEVTFNRARAAVPAGWVLKPVNEGELQTAIERALRQYRSGEPPVQVLHAPSYEFADWREGKDRYQRSS